MFAGRMDSPMLLLLHGYGASADTFLRNIDALAQDFHVVAPDMAGFGFSEGAELGTQCLPVFLADHIESLLVRLKLSPNSICGHSFGGGVADLLHQRLQPNCGKLIIVSSGSALNTDAELQASLEALRARVPPPGETLAFDRLRGHIARSCFDPSTIPEPMVYARWIAAALPGVADFFARGLDSLMDLESWNHLRMRKRLEQSEQIGGRVLILSGKQDTGVPLRNAEIAQQRIAGCKHVAFDRCGHTPPYEQPDAFNAQVCDFLKR